MKHCLLDNIRNAKDDSRKILAILNALTFYFQNNQREPLDLFFFLLLCSVLKDLHQIYTWPEVLREITNFYKLDYQGIYDFKSALSAAK